jgi:hypothetical protein
MSLKQSVAAAGAVQATEALAGRVQTADGGGGGLHLSAVLTPGSVFQHDYDYNHDNNNNYQRLIIIIVLATIITILTCSP